MAPEPLAAKRIADQAQKWFLTEPLFFAAWTSHRLTENHAIATMRVGRGLIEYNPRFVQSLDDSLLVELMKFESLRILLKHPYERKKPNADFAWEASNLSIRECQPTRLPFATARERFGSDEFNARHFEYYYNLLCDPDGSNVSRCSSDGDEDDGECEGEDGDGECDGNGDSDCQGTGECEGEGECDGNGDGKGKGKGRGGDSDSNDSNATGRYTDRPSEQTPRSGGDLNSFADPRELAAENTVHWDFDQLQIERINDVVDEIQSSNHWGTAPGSAREMILAARTPRLDYRRVLKAFRASILSTDRAQTRMRPSRRYGFETMGSRRDFTTRILFAVDVSGSVGSQDIRRAFAIVNRLLKYGIESVDVVWFDTTIRNDEPITLKRARTEIEVDGRGGTCFQPIMDFLDAHLEYDGLIVFTDGYAPVPEPPQRNRKTRTVWLFNHEENWKENHKQLERPGVTSAFVLAD